jgi:hypothetical protein
MPGTGPTDLGNAAATPSMRALPVETGTTTGGPLDASNVNKFYTFSVDLRETYDSNVGTSSKNSVSSLESSISPSILVDFPMENTEFSAAYTFGATYYTQTANTGSSWQYSNSFVAQLRHDFSERLTVNAADSLTDSTDPNIFGTTGTPYRDGQNVSNAFTAGASMQWTPLIGTQTTYGNTIVRYLDTPSVAAQEDSMENTVQQTVSFAILPKISFNAGGIFDDDTYDQSPRGYTSYTGFVGTTWEALPNLSGGLRGGATYTETQQTQLGGQSGTEGTMSPYADVNVSWQIGSHSSLAADYSHEVTPSDYFGSNGQISDRITGNFNYQFNPRLSAHLQVSYSDNDISGAFIYNRSSTASYTETVYGLDVGASYNFVKYFSLTFDITESGVSSELTEQSYDRSEVSLGIRGTY